MTSQNRYNDDELVSEFGIQVRSEMTSINARVLNPPRVIVFFLPSAVLNSRFYLLFLPELTLIWILFVNARLNIMNQAENQ